VSECVTVALPSRLLGNFRNEPPVVSSNPLAECAPRAFSEHTGLPISRGANFRFFSTQKKQTPCQCADAVTCALEIGSIPPPEQSPTRGYRQLAKRLRASIFYIRLYRVKRITAYLVHSLGAPLASITKSLTCLAQ